ncbi:head GIN domain-containing protein [Flavobacterium sp. N2270]|uniref:head GIN domain-containing protein n=1 Tax=Flavobacterium sp. N2270 TaxID=2986831 RepID=UPI0022251B3C|nr:head GIN domain-containing protein [Flavobacterium sp. N2270]
MKTTIKLFALFILVGFTSCKHNINFGNGIDGSGNIISEKRNIDQKFTKISASSGVDVIIEQGSPTEIEVETDDNLIEYVITKVENGTLIVKIDGNINNMSAIKVRVKMQTISSLESSSGSSITSKNKLNGSSIALKSSSGSEIDVELEYESVSCESTSGSEIKASGKALRLETQSSSGSEIDASNLAVNEVFAQSTSGSSTTVNPIVKLDAKASSGSSIDYIQEPTKITKEETSGGSVDKE